MGFMHVCIQTEEVQGLWMRYLGGHWCAVGYLGLPGSEPVCNPTSFLCCTMNCVPSDNLLYPDQWGKQHIMGARWASILLGPLACK